MLIIPNNATAEAAMRVGKVDGIGSMPVTDALSMMKTNPEIVVKQKPQGTEYTLDPRNDVAPFNNINVRIAMQHAINIPLIASTYYKNYATPWPAAPAARRGSPRHYVGGVVQRHADAPPAAGRFTRPTALSRAGL